MGIYYKGKLSLTKNIYSDLCVTLGYYVNSSSDNIIGYQDDLRNGIHLYHGYSYTE